MGSHFSAGVFKGDGTLSIYDEVLMSIISLMEETAPYAPILIGPMPESNGISIAWANGAPTSTFLNKNASMDMSLVLNGKHQEQATISSTLGRIHAALTRRKQYPESTKWQITDISTTNAPCYLGREQNNQWLYGSSLRVKFFLRGD